jgi:hypothetical protein
MKRHCALALLSTVAFLPRVVLAEDEPPLIEDNSFFIEEAYNQERGVVQHISNFVHFRGPAHRSDYSFTQEWPLGGPKHQGSYTVPYAWPNTGPRGFGDVALNYRYQLAGHDSWAAVAPRLSLLVPTGGAERGADTTGLQLNLPASRRVSRLLVVHANAGSTVFPSTGARAFSLGASAIALVAPRFNLMLEATATRTRERADDGTFSTGTELIVSPGVRGAINRGALQIVPGLALPLSFRTGETKLGFLIYLSFEHPFMK